MNLAATPTTTQPSACAPISDAARAEHDELQSPARNSEYSDYNSDRTADYPIYKPNPRGTGGVIRFCLNPIKAAIFVDAASQSGEKQFDWEHKITMKWGLSDIGAAIATLQGRIPQAKLFHQSERANSAFELIAQNDPARAPYLMSISRQDASDRSLRKVTIPISHSEAAVLETALKSAITRILKW